MTHFFRIYKWLGTYFDETEPIITTGAIKVASFTNNFFEIIIILQYSSNTSLLSTVYEFNFGRIKKIQHINASNPSHMDVFQSTIGTHVLIFEKSKNNLIYAWNGKILFPLIDFSMHFSYYRVQIGANFSISNKNGYQQVGDHNTK